MHTPYDHSHIPDREKLPDPQLTHKVEGADVPIQKVGINNFHVLVAVDGRPLEATLSVYVDLPAGVKGINMSRLVRTFYDQAVENDACLLEPEAGDEEGGAVRNFSVEGHSLKQLLSEIVKACEATAATAKFRFKYPMVQKALRSGGYGLQFYDAILEAKLSAEGETKIFQTVDFIYSSACPCSYELAKQATRDRGVDAISHSQRSRARVTVEVDEPDIQALVKKLRGALVTETQAFVKREDEQAFAELNGSHPKFVEDAARLIFGALGEYPDFVAECEHWESLHSHNAVSVISKGVPGGLN